MTKKKDVFKRETRPGRNGGTLIVPKKGEPSPNPNGRGKGALNMKTIINKWLSAETEENNPLTNTEIKATQADHIILALIRRAKLGDPQAFNAVMDRLMGKATQPLGNDPENPINPPALPDLSHLSADEIKDILMKQKPKK